MSRSRKLINNFIFSNNHQCNYTRTISLLRRLIVKCFFHVLCHGVLINWLHQFHLPLTFQLTEKGLCLVSFTFSILVVQRLSMILDLKTPWIIYILPKTYCHIFVTVTRHLYLAQREGSTRIVTVFIPKIIVFGSKPVDKI